MTAPPADATSPPRRTRARRGEGDALRGELLRAAEQLLVEAGDESGLTLRAVAQRVGVTTPSVYRHFAEKAALVEAVALRVWDELGWRMDAAAAGTDDVFEALRRRGVAYVRFGRDHPVQYQLLLMRPPPPGGALARDEAAASTCYRHFVAGVGAVVAAGIFRGEPETLAMGLWAAAHGVVSLLVAKPHFPWPEDLDAFVDHVISMAGLGTAALSTLPPPCAPPHPPAEDRP